MRLPLRCFSCLGRWLGLLAVVGAILRPAPAAAHPMPSSAVILDFRPGEVSAELFLPLQELELSFKQPLLEQPEQALPKYRAALKDYLLAHIHPIAPDGRPWTVEVSDLEVRLKEQPFDLVARLRMHPPAGAPVRQFKLGYDVVLHEVISHKAFVFIRQDWDAASVRPTEGQATAPTSDAIALFRYLVCAVDIDRPESGGAAKPSPAALGPETPPAVTR